MDNIDDYSLLDFEGFQPEQPNGTCESCNQFAVVIECELDRFTEILCPDFANEQGFCRSCGTFCAGIERFDFGPMTDFVIIARIR
jgi:hypothetical protein